MSHLTFILVQPQMGENIGFAARAMSNFDIIDLRIVMPRDGWPNDIALKTCAHGDKILNDAKIFESLEDAIGDLDFVIATSAHRRDMSIVQKNLGALNDEYVDNLAAQYAKIGVIFGRESSGLSNKELNCANMAINIETSENNLSLNLGHAVAIVGYALKNICCDVQSVQSDAVKSEANVDIDENGDDNEIVDCKSEVWNERRVFATAADVKHLREKLYNKLENSQFFAHNKKDLTKAKIQSMFNRFSMTKEEVKLLHGIFISI